MAAGEVDIIMSTEPSITETLEALFKTQKQETQPVKIMSTYAKWTYSELTKCTVSSPNYSLINKPDIEIINPRNNADVNVSQISLIPNDAAKTQGICKILVNDNEIIFNNKTAGDFEDVNELLLDFQNPILLKKHNSVKLFLKSGDSSEIKITALVKLSESQ